MITINCRNGDSRAERVVKYTNAHGHPSDFMNVRRINPDCAALSPLAKFIVDHADGKYIGGMNLVGFLVRVEGVPGSMREVDIKTHGQEYYKKLQHTYGLDPNERAVIRGWLFPVFEVSTDETDYFNHEAERIARVAGIGGRVIIGSAIFNI